MGKTTLTVDEATHERFRQLKRNLNDVQDAPDHTTDSFLSALMDTWDNAGDPGDLAAVAPEAFAKALAAELREAESGTHDTDTAALADLRDALATIEERTGRIERTLEDMGGRR